MTGKGFSGIRNILSYSSKGIVPRDVTTSSNIKSLINLVSKMILKEPSKNLGGFKYLIDAESDGDLGKSTLSFNCKYITCEIYPLINSHVKRMNANSFADIPESKSFKCVDVN